MKYTLNKNREVVAQPDLTQWATGFETLDRRVAKTHIANITISTVFLGIDHSMGTFTGPPLVFETMIFGGEYNDYQTRAASWEEAREQHRVAVALVLGTAYKDEEL